MFLIGTGLILANELSNANCLIKIAYIDGTYTLVNKNFQMEIVT